MKYPREQTRHWKPGKKKKLKLNTESLKQCKFCSLSFLFLKKNTVFGEGLDHFAQKSTQRPAPGSTEGHHQAMLRGTIGVAPSPGITHRAQHHALTPAPCRGVAAEKDLGQQKGELMERRVEGRKTLQLRRPWAVPSPCPGLQQPPWGGSSFGTPTSSWVWGDTRVKPRLLVNGICGA